MIPIRLLQYRDSAAASDVLNAIDLDPDDPCYVQFKARLYEYNDDLESAPDIAIDYLCRGRAYLMKNELLLAREDFMS